MRHLRPAGQNQLLVWREKTHTSLIIIKPGTELEFESPLW